MKIALGIIIVTLIIVEIHVVIAYFKSVFKH